MEASPREIVEKLLIRNDKKIASNPLTVMVIMLLGVFD